MRIYTNRKSFGRPFDSIRAIYRISEQRDGWQLEGIKADSKGFRKGAMLIGHADCLADCWIGSRSIGILTENFGVCLILVNSPTTK